MAERGMNVTAFDVTPEMIDEGKKRFGDLSGLRLYEGDIRSFRFDIPHVDFCYCTDFGHIHSIEEVKKALACINTHLRDGGCLVVETGLRLLDAKSHYTPTETFYPQKQVYPGIKVWKTGETRNDGETGRTYISQIFYAENESGNVESFNHAFYMQLYYREEWLAAFKECGFDIATESDNSGYHSFEAVKSAAEKEQESPTVGFPLMDFRHDPIDIATDRDYVLERHCRINYECDTPWARKLAYAQYRANWFVDTGQQKLGYYRYRYEYEKVLRQDNKNG
jgi:SAM-dependent methyltransferase